MTPSIFSAELSHEPVRIGVVGLGYWGPNLIRNLNELERPTCAGSATSTRRVDTFGRRYPTVRGTRHSKTCSSDPELDAVAIATPVSTHHPLALAALRAGQARVHREAARRLGCAGGGACSVAAQRASR